MSLECTLTRVRRVIFTNRRKFKVLAQSLVLSACIIVWYSVSNFPQFAEEQLLRSSDAVLKRTEDRRRPKLDLNEKDQEDKISYHSRRRAQIYGQRHGGYYMREYGIPFCQPTIHFMISAIDHIPNSQLWEKWFDSIKAPLSFSVHVHCQSGMTECQKSIPSGRLRDKLVKSREHVRCNDANHVVQMVKSALKESKMHKVTCDEEIEDRYILLDAATLPLMPFEEMYPILTGATSGFCVHPHRTWLSAEWATGSSADKIPRTDSFYMLTETEGKALVMSHERAAWGFVCDLGECCTEEYWPYVASHGLTSSERSDKTYYNGWYMGYNVESAWIDRATASKEKQGLCKHTYVPRFKETMAQVPAEDFAASVGVEYDQEVFGTGITRTHNSGAFVDASATTWKILAKSGYLFAGAIFGLETGYYIKDVQRELFKLPDESIESLSEIKERLKKAHSEHIEHGDQKKEL